MKQTSFKGRRILCVALGLLLVIGCFGFGASAEIFTSFTYDTSVNASVAPDAVNQTALIDSSSVGLPLGAVTDLCIDKEHSLLYAVDQTNSRILRMDLEGNVIKVLDGFDNGGVKDTFNAPTGMFIDAAGNLYVADTENERIVQLDKNDTLVRLIGTPQSTVLGENFVFKPTHLVLDSIGRFYVMSTGFNQGVLCLDEEGKFLNCTGTPDVAFDLLEYLWKSISTDAQKDRMASFVPTEYNNIAIDSEDFLFVTCNNVSTWDFIGGKAYSLRRLNAKGDDIIPSDGRYKPYGLRRHVNNGTFAGGALFEDVISLDDGMFAAVDENRGRVFVYNNESQLLFEFGTYGEYTGAFLFASALEYVDNTFYVADSKKGTVTVFTCNEYGKMLLSTAKLHKAGEYEAEQAVWDKVVSYNANSTVALVGMANMEYRNGDYDAAMEHFKLVNLTEEYSKAFKAKRQEILNQYSGWIVLILLLLCAGLVAVFKLYKRRLASEKYAPGRYEASLEFGRILAFRPLSRYWDLTWEKKGTLAGALTIFGLSEVIMILDAYASGYIFAGQSIMLTNPVTVVFKLPLLLFLYCVCNWCVTSLMDGKGTFKNIVIANCYALVPLVFLLPPAVVISNFITQEEGSFYHLLIALAYFWMFVMILCANRQVHDYSMSKSVVTILITVVVMVILVFLFVLFMVLMQQMVTFAADLVQDLILQFS